MFSLQLIYLYVLLESDVPCGNLQLPGYEHVLCKHYSLMDANKLIWHYNVRS